MSDPISIMVERMRPAAALSIFSMRIFFGGAILREFFFTHSVVTPILSKTSHIRSISAMRGIPWSVLTPLFKSVVHMRWSAPFLDVFTSIDPESFFPPSIIKSSVCSAFIIEIY